MPSALARPPHGSARPRPHRFTVAEYHRAGEAGVFPPEARLELLEGEIIEMAPVSPEHSGHVNGLLRLLIAKLGEHYVISPQNPVRLSSVSEPEPDFAVLKFRPDLYVRAHPKPADTLLLVEISESTLDYDLTRKLAAYAKAGIPDYWVVDLRGRCVHAFSKPRAGKYAAARVARGAEELVVAGLPGFAVKVSEVLL